MVVRGKVITLGKAPPTLTLSRNEVETLHWALKYAIFKCTSEIQAKQHMAENAMALVDYNGLKARVDEWLAKNQR
jgi:hypothetical protein